jgi:uncharacterized protein YkwD
VKTCCNMRLSGKSFLLVTILIVSITLIGCSTSPPPVSSTPPATESSPTLNPVLSPSPTATTILSPSPALTPGSSPMPTSIYTPAASPFQLTQAQIELLQYTLNLINQDRENANLGLSPVDLGFNAAAQKHAQDMLDNHYLAHWGTDGFKPYMRYTLEGGLNYEGENCAYSTGSGPVDVIQEIQSLEHIMVFDDAGSNWLHRDNILNKWHKKVNIGIAYNNNSAALVQQFEGDYLEYFQPPTITGDQLSLSFRFKQTDFILNNVSIAYDSLPQPLTGDQLNGGPYHSYSLGERLGYIVPPPPPGQQYVDLPDDVIISKRWDMDQSGQFYIKADIGPVLSSGKGVYTIVLVAVTGNDSINLSNYSIFVN